MFKVTETIWTAEEVFYQLAEAASTIKALRLSSRDFPSNKATYWPDVVRDAMEAYGYDAPKFSRETPSAEAITRMDRALRWLLWIDQDQRRIAWARAEGIPWRKLEDWDGRSRTTLQKVHNEAIDAIRGKLNASVIAQAVAFTWGTGTGAAYG